MADKQIKDEDVSLDQMISEMDMIIDDIIFNKTSKSQYVRKEGEKLLALQFPLSDGSYWDQVEKKYAALQQMALIYPENSEIQRIVCCALYSKPDSRKKSLLLDHISEVYNILSTKYRRGLHFVIGGVFLVANRLSKVFCHRGRCTQLSCVPNVEMSSHPSCPI